MAFDSVLAERIRVAIRRRKGFEEKKMFGGVGFMLNGNLCLAIWEDSLVARIGIEAYEAALREPEVSKFDLTGRAMRGWVMVSPAGLTEEEDLKQWIGLAVSFVRTLPAK